ncbi:unnamed protein product [Cylindrotheca closterium]|uniref:Multicopper oxidase n=1 Tax=Cylindrotheca closterium TaxID=2856 RepID=A0AAD2CH72_9STRA|nr:unnamed protein product [Cylindrotheca closterium]
MKYCKYGSIEDGDDLRPENTDLSSGGAEKQYLQPTRLRFIVSALFMLVVAFVLAETLHIPFKNIHTFQDEESSLIQDTSNSVVLSSTTSSSALLASENSTSLESFQWRRVSNGNFYVGYLEFCNIGNDTFFYRTAVSPTNSSSIPCENSKSTVSPVIRIRPRMNYKLILINRSNQPTNLHTHGFHVSGVGISDDITRKVDPGFCLEYHYRIKDNADVGTFWYHSHRHPISSKQVAGGAYGLLIIDEPHMDTFPLHLQRFFRNEVLLQYAGIRHKDKIHRTHLLNGRKEAMNITMNSNEYYYFRVSFVVISDPVSYFEILPEGACEARPMAYDGVFRSTLPHPESSAKHMLTLSSRLDLAMKCTDDAQVVFHQGELSSGAGLLNIRVIGDDNDASKETKSKQVRASPYWDAEQETSWTPRRPYYMPDLVNVNTNFWKVNKWNVTMDSVMVTKGNDTKPVKKWSINQMRWDPDIAIRELQLGQLVEWTLVNTGPHPFHIHVNKMQIVQEGGCGYRYEEGEYYDTISSEEPCLVRLQFWDFSGRIVAHCHKLSHEDHGMMVWIDVMGSDHGVNGTKQAECSDFALLDPQGP